MSSLKKIRKEIQQRIIDFIDSRDRKSVLKELSSILFTVENQVQTLEEELGVTSATDTEEEEANKELNQEAQVSKAAEEGFSTIYEGKEDPTEVDPLLEEAKDNYRK